MSATSVGQVVGMSPPGRVLERAERPTDQATTAYGRFPGAPSRSAFERFFFLDDRDRALLERRRRDHNRLGFDPACE